MAGLSVPVIGGSLPVHVGGYSGASCPKGQ